jgi:Acetyltransferase (GNAT) domain
MSEDGTPMKPIYYREWILRVAELWFEAGRPEVKADVVRLMQAPAALAGDLSEPFHTLVFDLTASEDELLKGMDRTTRYKVKRAEERDELAYCHRPVGGLGDLSEFIAVYRSVERENSAPPLKLRRLAGLAEAKLLDLSTVRDRESRDLSWHVHIVTDGIARMLHSVSGYSNSDDQELQRVRGRANRLHHWLDMRRFRGAGCARYDFGGYYAGKDDEKKLRINFFKGGFGGRVVETFNCFYPRSALGWAALAGRRAIKGRPRSA